MNGSGVVLGECMRAGVRRVMYMDLCPCIISGSTGLRVGGVSIGESRTYSTLIRTVDSRRWHVAALIIQLTNCRDDPFSQHHQSCELSTVDRRAVSRRVQVSCVHFRCQLLFFFLVFLRSTTLIPSDRQPPSKAGKFVLVLLTRRRAGFRGPFVRIFFSLALSRFLMFATRRDGAKKVE